MSEPIIQLTNVEKSFKTGAVQNWVLRRINLEIMQGEFVTIMGPSGAGKTTLLSIIGLLDDEWRGEYFLGDQPIHKLSRKQKTELNKKSIGFVFQSYHLL